MSWWFGLYLMLGIVVWIVWDKTMRDMGEEVSTELQMISLIALWPIHLYNWMKGE